MPLFEWKDYYEVKIAEIDKQHHLLVDMLNELYESMRDKKAREELEGILKSLSDYAGIHFSYEEQLMKQYNYPGFFDHKREHDGFKSKVGEFLVKHKEGKLTLSIEVMNFLKDWLKNHIMGVDKRYSPFFIEKGVS